MSNLIHVDDNSLDALLESDLPVLVDFSAVWCGPCLRMEPILETFASNYIGRVLVVKVNIEESPKMSAKYNIRAVPTLILFNKGKLVWSKTGLVPMEVLESALGITIKD